MIGQIRKTLSERRAADDLVKVFSGEISSEDEKRLQGWSKNLTDYSLAFHETSQVLAKMEELSKDELLLSFTNDSAKDAENTSHRYSFGKWMGAAVAACLILATFAVTHWSNYFENPVSSDIKRYVTRVGEQKTINLDDGSVITLNTATQLLVDFTDDIRRMILDRGEAYFDVAKDEHRPFVVEVGDRSVSALGTEFDIYRLPEGFTVAVTEGMVALHQKEAFALDSSPLIKAEEGSQVLLDKSGQVRMSEGTVAVFNIEQQKLTAKSSESIDHYKNWRTGVVRFDSVPLYQVVKELNRYSAKKILIEDDSIMNLDLYATVQIKHLNEALNVFERALPVRVLHRFDHISIVGNN